MAKEAQNIPILDFSDEENLRHGSEKRKEMSRKVREACEKHGCFLCVYDKIPRKLREEMLVAMKALFDLPEETKSKYVNPNHYRSYVGSCPLVPLFQSLGVDDAHRLDNAQAFTLLMWPDGNPRFCEAFNSMSSKMMELNLLITKMIFESFGIDDQTGLFDSYVHDNTGVFRLMKYKSPPTTTADETDTAAVALPAHTDKNGLTILCQSEVQGLEVQSSDGDWVLVRVPKDAFTVVVGDALKAWSNGRVEAAKHRVVMGSGGEDRYACGLFSMPNNDTLIEVPSQLVDQQHPLLFRPFNFSDYISFFISSSSTDNDPLYSYARIF